MSMQWSSPQISVNPDVHIVSLGAISAKIQHSFYPTRVIPTESRSNSLVGVKRTFVMNNMGIYVIEFT